MLFVASCTLARNMADYSIAAHSSCEAEVAELHDVIAAHQDVLRLHIAVYHARLVRVEVMQSLHEFSKTRGLLIALQTARNASWNEMGRETTNEVDHLHMKQTCRYHWKKNKIWKLLIVLEISAIQ